MTTHMAHGPTPSDRSTPAGYPGVEEDLGARRCRGVIIEQGYRCQPNVYSCRRCAERYRITECLRCRETMCAACWHEERPTYTIPGICLSCRTSPCFATLDETHLYSK